MDLIRKYFPDLTNTQEGQFKILLDLLPQLNTAVNVISRKDAMHLEERHVLHSLAIARKFSFTAGELVIDAGTGGGFPGLPLAVIHPETRFILSDSIGKKIRLVNELRAEMKLKNVEAIHGRVEDLGLQADWVVSRAVAPMPRLYAWTRPLLRPSESGKKRGIIALKGGDLREELAPFGARAELSPVSAYFKEEFFSSKMIVFLKI